MRARALAQERRLPPERPWLKFVLIGLLVAVTFVAARSCQQSQVRFSKESAITTAQSRINFTPTRTQIRLLRQGLTSRPFWIVSLSVPAKDGVGFDKLAVVRINANTGKVETVRIQRAQPREEDAGGG